MILASFEIEPVLQPDELEQIEITSSATVDLLGEIAMTGCPIYPDCPTPNSCSEGCKYGGVMLATIVEQM